MINVNPTMPATSAETGPLGQEQSVPEVPAHAAGFPTIWMAENHPEHLFRLPTPIIITEPVRQLRANLGDTIEEIGSVMGLLREAITDVESGNLPGGVMCASDALSLLASLEARYSELTADLTRWITRNEGN